jgi:hypothetical protein
VCLAKEKRKRGRGKGREGAQKERRQTASSFLFTLLSIVESYKMIQKTCEMIKRAYKR